MGDFYDKITKRIEAAKGTQSAIQAGATMTGSQPNQILINPDVRLRTEEFKSFLDYIEEKTLSASGRDTEYHTNRYIAPYIGKKNTHTLSGQIDGLSSDSPVTVHGYEDIKGKRHAIVSQNDGERKKIIFSKLNKPNTKVKNAGHKYEQDFANRLKTRGIMPSHIQTAGSTAGTDFVAENRRKRVMHPGIVTDESYLHGGETKQNTNAAFGQLTINHDPKRGWHIPDKARSLRPGYADEIEKAGIIDHMNKNYPDPYNVPTTASGKAKNVEFDHPNLDPAEAYLNDHHVEFLQVGGGKGTYRVGDVDKTGHGLPRISGRGKWTVREKQRGNKTSRTIQFRPNGSKGLNASHVNLDTDPHLEEFADTLGHPKKNSEPERTETHTAPTAWAESVNADMHRRHHTLFWGRANPPHAGHEEAYKKVKENIRKTGGTGSIILSRSYDPRKNPLTPEQKEKHAKRAFPDVNTAVADAKHPTLLNQLSKLHEQGVTHLHMVAGSDRIPEYNKLINKYNGVPGTHGYYNFKHVNLISSGERDPDAEGTAGISASTQRQHVQNNDLKSFSAGAPTSMKASHVKEMFNDVKAGMNPPKKTVKQLRKAK